MNIKVAAPTKLDYSLTITGDADIEAGASLDVDLGNNIVHYDSDGGWTHDTHDPTVSVTPLLSVESQASADLTFNVKTSLQVNVDNIIWYHLNMTPSMDTHLKFDGSATATAQHGQVCLDGNAAFTMEQEANLDWDLVVWHAKDHWGPNQLYSWSKPGFIHACKALDHSALLVV